MGLTARRSSRWGIVVGSLAALAALAGGAASTARSAAPANVYVAATGSDSNPCTQAAPCQSFDRAYRVATAGQVVQVAAGSYPAQTIGVDTSKTSTIDVVIGAAPGSAVVVTGAVTVYGKHLELRDMTFSGGWTTKYPAVDVTFRNVKAKLISIQSSRYVNVLGGEVGPWTATGEGDPKISKSSAGSTTVPSNIVIDGVLFHDIVRPAGSGFHTECLQIGAAVNLTIRNSRFENCATHAILLTSWGSSYTLQNITIEDNLFGAVPDGYHSLTLDITSAGAPCQSCTIRRNTAGKPIATNVERSGSTIFVTENSMSKADLAAPGWCDHGLYGVTWDRNTFSAPPTCGTNAVLAP